MRERKKKLYANDRRGEEKRGKSIVLFDTCLREEIEILFLIKEEKKSKKSQ